MSRVRTHSPQRAARAQHLELLERERLLLFGGRRLLCRALQLNERELLGGERFNVLLAVVHPAPQRRHRSRVAWTRAGPSPDAPCCCTAHQEVQQ